MLLGVFFVLRYMLYYTHGNDRKQTSGDYRYPLGYTGRHRKYREIVRKNRSDGIVAWYQISEKKM